MDANGSATTNISQCTIYNTIHHVTYASETKITSTTTAPEETIKDLDCRPVVWQRSERISQMQFHLESVASTAALISAPHNRQMIPLLDWRLLQGPIRRREQMEYYAKRDPLFVASLFLKSSPENRDLDWMLSWLSETVINVHKLCTQPMVLITLNEEVSYTGRHLKYHGSRRLDISIIETGHTTRIPRYQLLHDPTRARPRTIPPSRSVPASTVASSSSNDRQVVPAPRKISLPKLGPKPPPPALRPNTNQGVSRIIPARIRPATIALRAIEAPLTNISIPKLASRPSSIPLRNSPLPVRPVSGVRPSTQQDQSPKKESTLAGQLEELKETVKRQGVILEKQTMVLETLTARLG
ncbi:hypothetical protein BDN72DRAFT_129134 [Pluteus cervinus]|uniref:Uncharacterized protein n=1 Tax=Pluteus cervinus TaxID=181527 RepID=A0ACD3AM70_9AGAR|nr:hypothetical protein BDN72DRAFT_129134 [Pluteus cervinus]